MLAIINLFCCFHEFLGHFQNIANVWRVKLEKLVMALINVLLKYLSEN